MDTYIKVLDDWMTAFTWKDVLNNFSDSCPIVALADENGKGEELMNYIDNVFCDYAPTREELEDMLASKNYDSCLEILGIEDTEENYNLFDLVYFPR